MSNLEPLPDMPVAEGFDIWFPRRLLPVRAVVESRKCQNGRRFSLCHLKKWLPENFPKICDLSYCRIDSFGFVLYYLVGMLVFYGGGGFGLGQVGLEGSAASCGAASWG